MGVSVGVVLIKLIDVGGPSLLWVVFFLDRASGAV